MSTKTAVMIGMTIGSLIGGYAPTLLGADFLSFWGIIGSAVGGILGIFVAYKLFNS